jgi:hypothetical protein
MYSYAANILSMNSQQKHGHFTDAFISAVGSGSRNTANRSYVQVFSDAADHLSSISTENPIVPELSTNADHEIHEVLAL